MTLSASQAQMMSRPWFYPFEFEGGERVPCMLNNGADAIHVTRRAMMESALRERLGDDLGTRSCCDIGCNQGYFAEAASALGFRDVLATDLRAENVADATLVAKAFGRQNLRTEQRSLDAHTVDELGAFDVVLLLGVLYHLEDPLRGLRRASAMASELLLLETAVVPDHDISVPWGGVHNVVPACGTFALFDGRRQIADMPLVGNERRFSLVPSVNALRAILAELGFARVEQVPVPADGYALLRSGDRVMLACQR